MFSMPTGIYARYETEEEKQKIALIADRLQIRKPGPLYDVLSAAVVNIKNENDIDAVMRRILEERPELQTQNEFENLEQYMFDLYYEIKINSQIDAISADKNNPFASMEKDKLNRIIIDYLGKITFHMSINNINSINTMTLKEIFGEDSSKVQSVIDCSPFMIKDSETNYRFLSDYVKNSIMAKYSVSAALVSDLSGIPDFEDDENFDTKRNSPGRRSS